MAKVHGVGTVVATKESPTPQEFHFVISDEEMRKNIESGSFVQIKHFDTIILAVVQQLRRANRYFSSPDIVHGSTQSVSVASVYPAERWDYILAEAKVLGCYKDGLQQRATRPVVPGSIVNTADQGLLKKFLGISSNGLNIGSLKQVDFPVKIDIDRLLKKHLAILSISGGGKSYTTSVIIEELLQRSHSQGRPAVILFDVHGEYKHLNTLSKHSKFKHASVKYVTANRIAMSVNHLSVSDFARIFPSMSYAQQRELSATLAHLRKKNRGLTVENVIEGVYQREMNQLVKDALLGWLGQLKHAYLFGNAENPVLEEDIQPGRLIIFDLSAITSLWKKRIIVHYFLSRIFDLRRQREIPPVVSFLEESHQFAPEVESSSAKSIIHTIAREGRKFLCSLVLISQRPVNLSTTALSQCNSHLILRILNPHDLTYIGKTSEGISQETLGMLTTLGVGEGLLVGEAVKYPIFLQVRKKLIHAEFDESSLANESKFYEPKNIQYAK